MKIHFKIVTGLYTLTLLSACMSPQSKSEKPKNISLNLQHNECRRTENFTLAIHGGAGDTTQEDRIKRAPVMKSILTKGHEMLKEGARAIDVVVMAVSEMENSAVFNAGRGGISNKEGIVELDAAIMDGSNRKAGSIAAVHNVKNPILAARKVMEESENVMFVGLGAENFAKAHGLKPISQSYFINRKIHKNPNQKDKRHGTVGAVALDQCGHLAAATSTGGWDEKIPGRVGDSPIIGAGTFAADESCAVSATGHGEFFIRWTVARDIAAKVEYQSLNINDAATQVIEKLKTKGGEGGVIALDRFGNFSLPYNSASMSRGYVKSNGETAVGFEKEMNY
jgi:beta-aspartyl-peptidase (threonine type)